MYSAKYRQHHDTVLHTDAVNLKTSRMPETSKMVNRPRHQHCFGSSGWAELRTGTGFLTLNHNFENKGSWSPGLHW